MNSKAYQIYIFFNPKVSSTFMLSKNYFIEDGKIVTWSEVIMRSLQEGGEE